RSGRPGRSLHPVAMMDDRRAAVRAHARLRQRERRRTEGAFGRYAADDPVRAPATRAMIHLTLTVHRVITAAGGIMRHPQIAKRRIGRHKTVPFGRLERSNTPEVACFRYPTIHKYRFGTVYRVRKATVYNDRKARAGRAFNAGSAARRAAPTARTTAPA